MNECGPLNEVARLIMRGDQGGSLTLEFGVAMTRLLEKRSTLLRRAIQRLLKNCFNSLPAVRIIATKL